MTAIEITTTPNGFSALVDALWDGKVSEHDFVKTAHQLGVSLARIEWELEQVKAEDGVLA